jgi:hypothetical protein
MNKKRCPRCGIDKDESEFWLNPKAKDGLQVWCKSCCRDYNRANLKVRRALHYKRKGVSEEEYEKMFDSQLGACAICKRPQKELKRALAVDHSHESGKIRGLLCDNCNRLLGYSKDSPLILHEAIIYLKRNES